MGHQIFSLLQKVQVYMCIMYAHRYDKRMDRYMYVHREKAAMEELQ